MAEEYSIRKMTFQDIDQVLEVENLSFPSPWSRSSFEAEINDNLFAHYYVVFKDHKVVGYAGMWMIIDEAHVTNIAVHPEFRGLNFGKRLTQTLIMQAFRQGANRITLEVRVSNLIARNLYKDLGFNEAGIRKGYYSDNNENAIIMWKNILVSGDEPGGDILC
ncbi:MAG: ribosomal-protein-alanine acetyltransferase [Desulfitibacter sp. BRH_c19]|nr:MAG: ribosomal-protein-alanine acetyltransferase [Desulfitibacter sp. BRH_c19]